MIELSKKIIKGLDDIIGKEEKSLPALISKKYIEECIIPQMELREKVHCNIAVVAPVSAGKSTLFNALCGYPILPVASGITSSVPTYINRVTNQDDECITIYGLEEKEEEINGVKYTHYVKTEQKKSLKAKDISKAMFNELFEYIFDVMHGDEKGNIKTTVENVAYFMKDRDKAYTIFKGLNAEKHALEKTDYALKYENPRHRLLLLLILLCVYVDQNNDKANMDSYIKKINKQRETLLKKYNVSADRDYCVYLDWCSEDLPEDVTLIDLPGTGSSTENINSQSSHTKLVRGILEEADAVWVLCSDNGTVETDLMNALNDITVRNTTKNKVCIYNCKNDNPNDSTPVSDFVKLLPALAGERCYVVNALAGEYIYTKNKIGADFTKYASDKRRNNRNRWPDVNDIISDMEYMYEDSEEAYCTFATGRDSNNNIIVTQDQNKRYTLKTFFESALVDYVGRLKYELAMKQFIEQSGFYSNIRHRLVSSRSTLDALTGVDEKIITAVTKALENAQKSAANEYATKVTVCSQKLKEKLEPLSGKLNAKIREKFEECLNNLITKIKDEWATLVTEGHKNCLEANLFGKYSMGEDKPNFQKFLNVKKSTEVMVNMTAFEDALQLADEEIEKFRELLVGYVNDLKNITSNFKNNYIKAFSDEYIKQKERVLSDDKTITANIGKDFDKAHDAMKKQLVKDLEKVCQEISSGFDKLIAEDGIFVGLCKKTADEFRKSYTNAVLDIIRKDLIERYSNIQKGFFHLSFTGPRQISDLLHANFQNEEKKYKDNLEKVISAIYGENIGTEAEENFQQNLTYETEQFAAREITNGADRKIKELHGRMSSMINYAVSTAVNITDVKENLDFYIKIWGEIGEDYKKLGDTLVEGGTENTKKLYAACKAAIGRVKEAK